MPQLVIIADDLTGAADTGAAFAEAGHSTVILFGDAPPPPADVIVLSTESRDLDARAATEAVRDTVRTHLGEEGDSGPRWIYKKIDSGLRGHPREELLALMETLGETRAVVAPAFPAAGRTTLTGRQYIDGVPVESSALATAGTPWNLVAVFRNDRDVPVRLLNLAMLRGRPALTQRVLSERMRGIAVADALTDDDLRLLAQAVIQSRTRVLCGAAGFARQLAHVLPLRSSKQTPRFVARRPGPILVVAGSRHEATTRQIATLRRAGLPVVALAQELVDDPSTPLAPVVTRVAEQLAGGHDVVLTSDGLRDCALGADHVAALLGRIVSASDVGERAGGLVLTGGDVAAAVCAALGATALWLDGELLPGIPLSRIEGGQAAGALVVTKAGSFGGEDALLTSIAQLTSRLVR